MKKLDWYIIRNFLTTFFFSIFLFTVISVMVDVSEKTDDFVKSGLSASQIFMQYYIAFIPHIVALLFPLFVLIAVIFFTSKMAGRSEIIAILASGVSLRRFLRPYLIGGLFLAAILWYANQYVIPRSEIKRTTFKNVYVDGNSSYNALIGKTGNYYFRIDSFTYAGMHYFDMTTQSGGPFFMNKIKDNIVVYNLRSNTIRWDSTSKKWQLNSVLERTVNGLKETVKTRDDSAMKFPFHPKDLIYDEYAKDKMTTPELDRYIQIEELRGTEGLSSLQMERYRRDATSVSVIILALIGAIIASKKVRGGSGAHIAIGFILGALFILMDRFSTIFSTKGSFPPLIAAWLPNVIFAFVAYYLYKKSPK